MGIKLHGTHNVLTTLLKNNRHVITIDPNTTDSWGRFNNILVKVGTQSAFGYLQELSMEGLQNYRELIRNTMLRHEETFRQQVHDLHRLYRVQKMLMAEMRSKEEMLRSHRIVTSRGFTDARTRFQGSISTPETSHSSHVSTTHHSTTHLNSYSPLHHYNTRAGPSSQELSICSEDPLRMQKGFDLEQPAEEHTSTEVRHNKDQTTNLGKHLKVQMSTEGSDLWTEVESDVELTLGIGRGTNKKRSEHWLSLNNEISCSRPTPSETRPLRLSTTVRPERAEECSDRSAGPWLFQALSLNKT